MPVQSNRKAKDELFLRKEDHWENIRRSEKYKKKYDEYKKFLQKRTGRDRFPRTKAMALGFEIADEFQLSEPIDPATKFSSELVAKILSGEAFVFFPSKKNPGPILHQAKESSFIVHDEDFESPSHVGAGSSYAPYRRKGKRTECLFEGKYLGVLLDIDLPLKQIKAIASEAVRAAKKGLEDGPGIIEMRARFEDNKTARKAFDLKKEGLSIKEIARKLFPDDHHGANRVKEFLSKAERLINPLRVTK